MGISGLLPLLKSIQQYKHISELAGKTLAVDAYVWLHRGAYGCAMELATGRPTTGYIDHTLKRIRLMRHHAVEPFLVFDGGPLPAKTGTEVERERKREEARDKAQAFTRQGRHSEAREQYAKCLDISPQLAFQLIKALRAENVQYIVAPYEADAQLVHLERIGLVDGIITEDSDLLVFGAQNVFFKLDTDGSCVHISRADFGKVREVNLVGWTDVQFREMAVLSGCDYLPSINGMGLKTAWKYLKKCKSVERVVRSLRLEGKKTVPHGYEDQFRMAVLPFLYQRVYCPQAEKLVYLSPIPENEWDAEKERYVGSDLSVDVAQGIATGDICPISHEPMEDLFPSYQPVKRKALLLNDELGLPSKDQKRIDSFFTSKPAVRKPVPITRGESGKRTLSGEMETVVATRRRKAAEIKEADGVLDANGRSRYFGATSKQKPAPVTPKSGSVQREPVTAPRPQCIKVTNRTAKETPAVEQEAGYRSPSSSTAPFVSSPTKSTKDESQSSILQTQVTTPTATGLGATLSLGVPETPTASYYSAEVEVGRSAYELSIDLEQVFSQGCDDAGVDETQLLSQGSSRAGSSFDSLEHHGETSGHTTDATETQECRVSESEYGVPESEYGVPESDVEVALPQTRSSELVEADEELADEANARVEVIARGWRTRFSLAAVAGRSAPGEESKAVAQIRRRETNLSPIAARRRKASAKAPLQSVNVNVDPHSPSRHPVKAPIAKRPRHSEPTFPVSLNLIPDSPPPKRPKFVDSKEPTPGSSSHERLNAFRFVK